MLKIFQSCGSGCKLLWNDGSKQGEGYGTVNRHDHTGEDSDDPFEDDSVPDIVFAQPYPKTIWTEDIMTSPIVKNVVPTVITSKNGHAEASMLPASPIVRSSLPAVKDSSQAKDTHSIKTNRPTIQNSVETPSPRVGVHSSSYTKTNSSKSLQSSRNSQSGKSLQSSSTSNINNSSSKSTAKSQHNVEEEIQMVSVV